MEGTLKTPVRTYNRDQAEAVAEGIALERNRIRGNSNWIFDALLEKASQFVSEGRRDDADFIRAHVRNLRNITA